MRPNRLLLFLALELALCLAGGGLLLLLPGPPPPTPWRPLLPALGRALPACLPLLAFAALATSESGLRLKPLRAVYDALADSPIGEFLRENRWPAFLALSAAAGICEELVFRGLLQPAAGLWAAAAVFGLFHALSWTYFLIAAAVGLYLGWLYAWTGSLAAPAFAHALYDFAALCLYRRRMRLESARN